MTGVLQDQNLEKQMGCLAGFLQLFDRHQLLTGKRLYTNKRLPPARAVDVTTESEKSIGSPAMSKELGTLQEIGPPSSPSRGRLRPSLVPELQKTAPETTTPVEMPPRSPLPLPIFELKEGTRSSWKFCKEAPRLSLDSRATVDVKGGLHPRGIRTHASISANRCENSEDGAGDDNDDKQRRSPSVIARLMGLEPLPPSDPEPGKNAELRRSASESRVSRDLFQYRFVEGNNFQLQRPNQSHSAGTDVTSNVMRDNAAVGRDSKSSTLKSMDPMEYSSRNSRSERLKASNRGGLGGLPWKTPHQRKSFFDAVDHFPEPKQMVSITGEIERRLKMRGIDEPSKDLETLKQILEALQLKGLLHSKRPSEKISYRNFVYDRNSPYDESPIVVMKPSRSPSTPANRRIGNVSPSSNFRSKAGFQRNVSGENLPSVSPRRERPIGERNVQSPTRSRNSSSPTRSESVARRSNSFVKPKQLSVETQRRLNDSTEQRRVSPINSSKLSLRRKLRPTQPKSPSRPINLNLSNADLPSFSLSAIQSATRNFYESRIVVMKPSQSPSTTANCRNGNVSPSSTFICKAGFQRNVSGENLPSVSPRRERPTGERNVQSATGSRNSSSPTRSESVARRSTSLVKPKQLSVETQRRLNDTTEQRRLSSIDSPKLSSRRIGSDQTVSSRSPRNERSQSGTVSISSQTDTERLKMDEYSSFYKDEPSSPSPVIKRCIDIKDQAIEFDEDMWSSAISPLRSKSDDISDDGDFIYISEILWATNYLPEDSDLFLLLEKQQYLKGNDTSKPSRLQRKLVFDTIAEILDQKRQFPLWKIVYVTDSGATKPSLQKIWTEFQKIRKRDATAVEDLFEIICGVLRKDLTGDGASGWGDSPVEMLAVVSNIEWLIFDDLVREMIRDRGVRRRKHSRCGVSEEVVVLGRTEDLSGPTLPRIRIPLKNQALISDMFG